MTILRFCVYKNYIFFICSELQIENERKYIYISCHENQANFITMIFYVICMIGLFSGIESLTTLHIPEKESKYFIKFIVFCS